MTDFRIGRPSKRENVPENERMFKAHAEREGEHLNSDIYQELWDNDTDRFSVSARAGESWTDLNADILLDEQARAAGVDSHFKLTAIS